jgi:glutamyl/glutaminyl-tRNA synthetase
VDAAGFLEEGYLPEVLLNFIMFLGWNPGTEREIYSLQDFVKDFSIEKIQTSEMAAFDRKKLSWFNGIYIRNISLEDLWGRIEDWHKKYSKELNLKGFNQEYNLKILEMVRDRMKTLSEFNDLSSYFYQKPKIEKGIVEKFTGNTQRAKEIIKNYLKVYQDIPAEDWNIDYLDKISHDKLEEFLYKPKEAFMTIRYVVTGREFTPPLFDVLGVLGKKETVDRMKKF